MRSMKFRAFVIAIALLSCSRVELVSRSPEPIARALAAKPHRLSVVFWPEASGCISCDQMISEVMSEWLAAPDAQTVVVTVIPNRERAFQPWLPGVVVRLDREDYRRFAGSAPLPRVEIRDAKGAVLLSRSIPKNGLQAELLKEEMLAARSFTAPVPIAAGVSP